MKLLPWSKLSSFLFHLSAMAFVTAIAAQDETISGNLTVNGQTDIIAGPLTLGTANFDFDGNVQLSAEGYSIHYQDFASYGEGAFYEAGTSTIIHQAGQEMANFLWKVSNRNNSDGFMEELMLLSNQQLVVYPSVAEFIVHPSITGWGSTNILPYQTLFSDAAIVTRILGDARYLAKSGGTITGNLVVNGTATFNSLTASFTGSGTDNRLPNQVANNEHSIITKGIADSNYLPAMGDNTIRIGGGANAVDWSGAIAIGSLASAGENAVAIGNHAGHWTISGLKSVAIGYVARAPGNYAIAIGEGNWGAGEDAIVIGKNAETSWSKAIAIGTGAQASQVNQVVIGTYNMPSPASGGLSPTNDLFILGNGTGPETENRSNALIVKRNGNMEVKGTSLTVNGAEVLTQAAAALVFQSKPEGEVTFVTSVDLVTLQADISNHYLSRDPVVGLAYGTGTEAIPQALALGQGSKATGLASSSAIGNGAIANQAGAHAIGNNVVANLPGQIVVGSYNEHGETEAGSSVVDDDDPVFVIGAGTGSGNRKNALVVKRNGDTEVTGVLRVEPAGNLSMGTFMAGKRPVPPPAE